MIIKSLTVQLILKRIGKSMDDTTHSNKTKPVYLRTSIVEPILIRCISEASFTNILNSVQKVSLIHEKDLRKYLYYLINDSFVEYNGKRKVFILVRYGADLLLVIYSQIQLNQLHIQDLKIKVE